MVIILKYETDLLRYLDFLYNLYSLIRETCLVRVLMISSEVTPFAQTGGMAEVLAALPQALTKIGVEVDVVMPMYRSIITSAAAGKFAIENTGKSVKLVLNDKRVSAEVWRLKGQDKPRQFFLRCDEYFDREGLYGAGETNFQDNAERFVFLSRAALELSVTMGIQYDVIHAHNWQSALAAVYLRTLYVAEPMLAKTASVITIHNLGYQGIFWHLDMPLVGVGWEFFTPKYMEFHGNVNFLKSGIVFSDQVNTVSAGYREEMLTPEYGFGLEGVLQEKGSDLVGILNGADYDIWNPEIDTIIKQKFSCQDLSGKKACKDDLQRLSKLSLDPDVPLIAMVGRFTTQKGIDTLENALPALMDKDIQVVILGDGENRFKDSLANLAKKHAGKMTAFLSYDYEMVHRIFAGADIVLVPSRYEPCGLNQLYAMRYGAVPIVRATGGLKDTVEQVNSESNTGTGFKYVDPTPQALNMVIDKALEIYKSRPDVWKAVVKRAMLQNFSWEQSAREYINIYQKAINKRMRMTSPGIKLG